MPSGVSAPAEWLIFSRTIVPCASEAPIVSDLRKLRTDIDEVSFNMLNVVQHQTAYRDRFKIVVSGISAPDARFRADRLHRQRDEHLKPFVSSCRSRT